MGPGERAIRELHSTWIAAVNASNGEQANGPCMDDQGTARAGGGSVRFRKLRIAWSVGWGILCLLLIGLWVRSYSWRDDVKVRLPADLYILFASEDGISGFLIRENNTGVSRIEIDSWPCNSEDIRFFPFNSDSYSPLGSYVWWFGDTAFGASAPYWFSAMLFTALTVAPWIRQWQWRFSLRTLLITTTLVAVLLGVFVWAAK